MKENNKAKLFISHHPGSLFLHKKCIQIIRKYDKDVKIILFKVNHPYFLKFDFEAYRKYFDEIIEFKFVNYKKNFFVGLWEILTFQRELKKIMAEYLEKFKSIDLLMTHSAWLPVNILLYNLSKQNNVKNIVELTMAEPEYSQIKTDKIRTFLCNLYSLPFQCYKIKAVKTMGGSTDFFYNEATPGTLVKLVDPFGDEVSDGDNSKNNLLPYYPTLPEHSLNIKKDMVIIFGDAGIFRQYPEYFPHYKALMEKLTLFLQQIERKYSDFRLYYKPHPSDEGKVMSGINQEKYALFDNAVSAQTLFDTHRERIGAIYTFSSSSVLFGAFCGIPSYTFYKYLCNQAGKEKFDSFFNQAGLRSKFLFHIEGLDEIGKIDYLEHKDNLDLKSIEESYRKILNC